MEGLIIDPPNPTLEVTGPGATIKFTVKDVATGELVQAGWSLDNSDAGTISAEGLFAASGYVGGVTRIVATVNGKIGTTSVTMNLKRSENLANIAAPVQDQLRTGGAQDAAFKWLYPYDRTVFPRGLMAPTLQFGGANADAYRVLVKSQYVEYEMFVSGAAGAVPQIPLTTQQWATITKSTTSGDRPTVSVSKISGGKVTGPISETWTIAQGTLKGAVYYNSYNSTMAREGTTTDYGSVLKIKPGSPATVFLGGKSNGCTVCHSVSANGNVLVAATEKKDPNSPASYWGETWMTGSATTPKSRARQEMTASFNWGALNPDGTVMLTNATKVTANTTNDWTPNVPGVQSEERASRLLDPKTGQTINAPGLPNNLFAMMPMYAPEGRRVAFTRYNAQTKGRTLSIMDYAPDSHTFSNLTDVYTDPSRQTTWPAFLPGDGRWIVTALNTSTEYATRSFGGAPGSSAGAQGAKSSLAIVNANTKTMAKLDQLNGLFNGQPYGPYTDDLDLNYEPTVLPQPVGGYYWVVFTSRRKYGNTITAASQDDHNRKKLWVAALDIASGELGGSDQARDISNPAFYISEQELTAGNMRAFWALDQCKALETECIPGTDDCCGGYCRFNDKAGKNMCVATTNTCKQENEDCASSAECCNGGTCGSNHKCTLPGPR